MLFSCIPLNELTELSICLMTLTSDSLSLESPTDGFMSLPNALGIRFVLGLVVVTSESVSESFIGSTRKFKFSCRCPFEVDGNWI